MLAPSWVRGLKYIKPAETFIRPVGGADPIFAATSVSRCVGGLNNPF